MKAVSSPVTQLRFGKLTSNILHYKETDREFSYLAPSARQQALTETGLNRLARTVSKKFGVDVYLNTAQSLIQAEVYSGQNNGALRKETAPDQMVRLATLSTNSRDLQLEQAADEYIERSLAKKGFTFEPLSPGVRRARFWNLATQLEMMV